MDNVDYFILVPFVEVFKKNIVYLVQSSWI